MKIVNTKVDEGLLEILQRGFYDRLTKKFEKVIEEHFVDRDYSDYDWIDFEPDTEHDYNWACRLHDFSEFEEMTGFDLPFFCLFGRSWADWISYLVKETGCISYAGVAEKAIESLKKKRPDRMEILDELDIETAWVFDYYGDENSLEIKAVEDMDLADWKTFFEKQREFSGVYWTDSGCEDGFELTDALFEIEELKETKTSANLSAFRYI